MVYKDYQNIGNIYSDVPSNTGQFASTDLVQLFFIRTPHNCAKSKTLRRIQDATQFGLIVLVVTSPLRSAHLSYVTTVRKSVMNSALSSN